MGIIKIRDELISVTCAILKDADRDFFFSQIRKNRAGNPEALAQWLGVPVALINHWMSGHIHMPYHTLQNIAYQFSVEMPPVGELRRVLARDTQRDALIGLSGRYQHYRTLIAGAAG